MRCRPAAGCPPASRRARRAPPTAPAGRPSIFPPRGFAPLQTPQFVVVTLEGPVTQNAFDLIAAITLNQTANGCPIRTTYFATSSGSGAAAVQGARRCLPRAGCLFRQPARCCRPSVQLCCRAVS